jgi:NAD-dependent SIR2 family protein deacetylase
VGEQFKAEMESIKQDVERLKQGIESGGQASCPKCGQTVTFEVIRETKPTPVTVYKCKRCGRGTLSAWEFVRAPGKTHYGYQQERMQYWADRIDAVAKQFDGK